MLRIAFTFLWVAMAMPVLADPATSLTIEVDPGEIARKNVPVTFAWPNDMVHGYYVVRDERGFHAPLQIEGQQATFMLDHLPAGKVHRFSVSFVLYEFAPEPSVVVADDGKAINVTVQGKPMLRYHHATVPSVKPDAPWFGRSGYIHPIRTPSGKVVTDDSPPDHLHQHGIMTAWTKTTFEGRSVDFWNSAKRQGRVEHVSFADKPMSGRVFGQFTAKLRHVDLTAPGGEKPVLDETWTIRVYHRSDGYLIDYESVQECAGPSPLQLHEYRYGGLLVRGARAWVRPGPGDFLTDAGLNRTTGNLQPARWCDVYGPLDGHVVGLAVLGHPANFRSPQTVRLHPQQPAMIWSPVAAGPFAIEPGERYVTRHRLFVHDGEPNAQEIETLWQDYANPVSVRVIGF